MSHILDTNALVHALSSDHWRTRAEELLDCALVSVQALNELANLLRRD